MSKSSFLTSAITLLLACSASAQGYFIFNASPRYVWDCWSQTAPRLAATNNVAFLWGAGTPLVAGIMASVPTNNSTAYSYTSAWSDILSDPNYTLAFNAQSNALAIAQCFANGAWTYNSATTFPVAGTSAAGGTTTVFVIGWDRNFATPLDAQAAGAAVGWSVPFTYSYANLIGVPASFSTAGLQPFGVGAAPDQNINPVPEPSIFALAGLGATALMIFRRKK